jgi:flagellar hook-associated protein 2
MAGTISFGGIGSGIDTEAIVTGLINASRAGLSPLKSRAASAKAAVSTISDISSLLSNLKAATEALDTEQELGSYKATSSHAAISTTTNPSARTGTYKVEIKQLATEQRTFTRDYASDTDAINEDGTLDITVGSGATETVTIEATDSLNDVADKINALDGRVSAAVIFDGSDYRLQIRGLDTGEANALSFGGTAADALQVNVLSNTVQNAGDARIELDTLEITSATNQIGGAIPGVTLNLNEEHLEAITIKIGVDSEALKGKVSQFISAYNAVVEKIHAEAGYGSLTAKNPTLAGDSSLRAVTNGLANTVLTNLAGDYGQTLAGVGIRLNDNATLRLDETQFSEAMKDPARVSMILAGSDSQAGLMDTMRDLVDGYTKTGTGLLHNKKETLQDRADRMNDRIQRDEARLDVQAELLRRQFTAMDQVVSANNAQLDYLIRMSVG